MSKYRSIKFDADLSESHKDITRAFEALDGILCEHLSVGRSSSIVHTKLEEAHMWVGKSLKELQLGRDFIDGVED